MRSRWSALLCCCTTVLLRAQPLFEHPSLGEAQLGPQILALFEDADGFIWIGTDAGLARHEGVRIRTWHHDRKAPRSLPNNTIWDITADETGTIWVATDHGICSYDPLNNAFDRVHITQARSNATSADRVHRIASDGHGVLWLATEDGIHTVSVRHRREIPLPANGSSVDRLTRKMKRFELAADHAHHGIFIGARHGTLFFDALAQRYIEAPTASLPFTCLSDTLAQNVQPDGVGGIWYYGPATRSVIHADSIGAITRALAFPEGTPVPNPQFLRCDRGGRLWISTWGHQVWTCAVGANYLERIAHSDDVAWSIGDDNAKSWLQDRQGRIWIGGFDGLSIADPRYGNLRVFRVADLPPDGAITSIVADPHHRFLIGTNGSGMLVIDRGSGMQQRFAVPERAVDPEQRRSMDHIERISVTAHGTLLASRFGLLETDSSAGIIRPFRPMVGAVPDELRSSTITFITPIDARHTWVGTWRSGVFEIGPDASVRSLDSALGPRSSSRMLLSCASNGNDIWLGFNNGDGLCRIRNGRVVERLLDQPDPDGMAYGVVRSLALDRSGNLYIGTLMGGLGIRDARSGAIQWFTRSDGVAGDRIEELVIDTNGGLWIRTAQGVCRMDLRTRTIQPVDLPTSIRGEHMIECLALDTDGAMLMGCGSVIVRYPPVAFGALAAPAVHVTGLWAGGHAFGRWSPDSVITLPPDQRTLSVECGVASFFDPSGVRFAYRLQDADTTWIALGEHARCDLGDLPIGQHTLQLRANNGGTRWSAEPLTLRLEVLPPFWATWWFRFTALFIIVSASITGFRIYLRERLREQREGLEREQAILAERVRIASDMHDDLGAGLSALKLRSEMALRVEQDPLKREHLGSLARSAGELISSMRQIIWTMNHDQADLADLFAYAGSYARMYCEEHGLKMDIITRSGVKQVRLTSEQRRNIFLTVKEALHNVVKHAGARSVHMTMAGEPGQLSVVIEDDGTGLPSNAADGLGNGLRNMHNRIRSLGGQLEVSAGAVRGTRVRFTVPLATASTEGSIAAMDQRDHLRGA